MKTKTMVFKVIKVKNDGSLYIKITDVVLALEQQNLLDLADVFRKLLKQSEDQYIEFGQGEN